MSLARDPEGAPRVSVVVPTYRRPDLLARCLQALLRQRGVLGGYEVLVCDDAASQDTQAQVQALAQARGGQAPLRYIPVRATRGPAGARNAGWRAARAPVIAFTDDDTEPAPDWLAQGLLAMAPGVDAACGRVVMPVPAVPSDYERDAAHLASAEFVTANCFVRRQALLAVDGFDERYALAWREDSDLHFKLLERGMRIVRAPEAIVLHPFRPVPFAAGLRMQKKVMYDVLLYKKFPRLYRAKVRAGPPWRYLLHTGCLVLALAAALAGWSALALGAGAAWLALTLAFFLQRLRGTRRTPALVADLALTSALIPLLSIAWRVAGAIRFRKGLP
ncbi:glycosyltransferase [Orrella sp. JC864]|uniref:glycosyltransferase family 2 protein n=1 Tax=Orrella sp. JC864 TaxID=3120298 RepID=UPI00300B1FA2